MNTKEALERMCMGCLSYPCKAFKNKNHCYSYKILNEALESQLKHCSNCSHLNVFHEGAYAECDCTTMIFSLNEEVKADSTYCNLWEKAE